MLSRSTIQTTSGQPTRLLRLKSYFKASLDLADLLLAGLLPNGSGAGVG